MKIGQKFCEKGHTHKKKKDTLQPIGGYSSQLILVYLDCSNFNEINLHFVMLKNMQLVEYGLNTIHDLSIRPYENNSDDK